MKNLQASNSAGVNFWLKVDGETYLAALESDADTVFEMCWTDDQQLAIPMPDQTINDIIGRAALVIGAVDTTMKPVPLAQVIQD